MKYLSLNRQTGQSINDAAHIFQSIHDILTTPRGSRIMRRSYGSDLFELIDQPQSPALDLKLMAATVMAITEWEPRVNISALRIEPAPQSGKLTIHLTVDRIDGERNTLPESYKVTL